MPSISSLASRSAAAVALAVASAFAAPLAQAAESSIFSPSSVFAQVGEAVGIQSLALGATWDWGRSWGVGPGRLGGYWETSVAGWTFHGAGGDRTGIAQLAFKPTFRYRFDDGASPWFGEAGVGLTVLNRHYTSDRKDFGSRFNFGDHLAVGRSFGERQEHELALRIEHFSNGGIKEPNPGATFLQLRYAYRFR